MEKPFGEVISMKERLAQRQALATLYETRGETALVDDITFAMRYLVALRHPSQSPRPNGLTGLILDDLSVEPPAMSVATLRPRQFGLQLIDIMNNKLYSDLKIDTRLDEYSLQERFDVADTLLEDMPQQIPLRTLRRLHLLTVVDSKVNDRPDPYMVVHISTLLSEAGYDPIDAA